MCKITEMHLVYITEMHLLVLFVLKRVRTSYPFSLLKKTTINLSKTLSTHILSYQSIKFKVSSINIKYIKEIIQHRSKLTICNFFYICKLFKFLYKFVEIDY